MYADVVSDVASVTKGLPPCVEWLGVPLVDDPTYESTPDDHVDRFDELAHAYHAYHMAPERRRHFWGAVDDAATARAALAAFDTAVCACGSCKEAVRRLTACASETPDGDDGENTMTPV